jgi:hypothetical protein
MPGKNGSIGKTNADKALEKQLGFLLGDGRRRPDPGPVMVIDEAAGERFRREQERKLPLDVASATELFRRYGTYLELIGQDGPVGKTRRFQFPTPKAS